MNSVEHHDTQVDNRTNRRDGCVGNVFAVVVDSVVQFATARAEKLRLRQIRREEKARAAAMAEFMRLAEAD